MPGRPRGIGCPRLWAGGLQAGGTSPLLGAKVGHPRGAGIHRVGLTGTQPTGQEWRPSPCRGVHGAVLCRDRVRPVHHVRLPARNGRSARCRATLGAQAGELPIRGVVNQAGLCRAAEIRFGHAGVSAVPTPKEVATNQFLVAAVAMLSSSERRRLVTALVPVAEAYLGCPAEAGLIHDSTDRQLASLSAERVARHLADRPFGQGSRTWWTGRTRSRRRLRRGHLDMDSVATPAPWAGCVEPTRWIPPLEGAPLRRPEGARSHQPAVRPPKARAPDPPRPPWHSDSGRCRVMWSLQASCDSVGATGGTRARSASDRSQTAWARDAREAGRLRSEFPR